MSAVTLQDRIGRSQVYSRKGVGDGCILVFKGSAQPKRIHV